MIFDELWTLQRKLDQTIRRYDRKRSRLVRIGAAPDDIEFLASDAQAVERDLESQIDWLRGLRLCRVAARLGIAVPEFLGSDDENWESGPRTNRVFMTKAAQQKLKDSIRLEEKSNREAWAFWFKEIIFPLITLLIGALGTATGFLSVFHRR